MSIAHVRSLAVVGGVSALLLLGAAGRPPLARTGESAEAATTAPPSAPAPRRFRLAVVRRDGILLPFATYDSGRWTNTWPPPSDRGEVPISLHDIPRKWWGNGGPPAPTQWKFWPAAGGASTSLRTLAPTWFTSQCEMSFGLRTDHTSDEQIPLSVQPYPKDGLATAGDIPVERIAILNGASADWVFANDVVRDSLTAKEDEWLGNARGAVGNRSLRHGTRIVMEALYRSPGLEAGSSIFYFEATKRYPGITREDGQKCDIVLMGGGWIARDRTGRADSGMRLSLTYCDMTGVEFMLPLGLIRLDGQALWVVQWAGWGQERYAVIDADLRRVTEVFSTWGGRCGGG